jgi:hypothetical protein
MFSLSQCYLHSNVSNAMGIALGYATHYLMARDSSLHPGAAVTDETVLLLMD